MILALYSKQGFTFQNYHIWEYFEYIALVIIFQNHQSNKQSEILFMRTISNTYNILR